MLAEVYGPGFGYLTDFQALVLWSAIFSFAVWLCVMLPLALRLDEDALFLRPAVAPFFGAACGWLACAALLFPLGGIELAGERLFAVQALITGACAWGLFALALRRPAFTMHPSRTAWIASLGPFALAALFTWVLWPALERVSPGTAYRFGASTARGRIFERTIRALRVGDSVDVLRRALPGEFGDEMMSTTGQIGARTIYRIRVENGRVAEVVLDERR